MMLYTIKLISRYIYIGNILIVMYLQKVILAIVYYLLFRVRYDKSQ